MRDMAPAFITRRRSDATWYIEVAWPNGRKEEVGNFPTAAEAEAEIKIRIDAFQEGERRYNVPLAVPRAKVTAGQ